MTRYVVRSREDSTALYDWWSQPAQNQPPNIRARLLGATFGKRTSVYFASICVFMLCGIALYKDDGRWPFIWIAVEVLLTGRRIYVMHLCEVALKNGASPPLGQLMFLGGLWSLVFGTGCAACLHTNILILGDVGGIAVAAIIVSIANRNSATPRFAILNMVLSGMPWSIVAMTSHSMHMAPAGILIVILTLGATAMIFQNHSDLVRLFYAEEQNWVAARTDPLTGLSNRTAFFEWTHHLRPDAKEDASTNVVSMLYIDLDGFKAINDQHGHSTGDLLLKLVSRRLMGALRAEDTVYRIGGDEFVVIMPRTNDENSREIGLRIIKLLSQPYHLRDGTVLTVGASVGSAVAKFDELETANLLARSDAALYEAKRTGKGRYVTANELKHVPA